jgi:hypothetical protein
VATILDTYMTLIKKKITEVESIVNKADNRKTAGKIYLPKEWIGKKVKTVLLSSLIVIAVVVLATSQVATAELTFKQKLQTDNIARHSKINLGLCTRLLTGDTSDKRVILFTKNTAEALNDCDEDVINTVNWCKYVSEEADEFRKSGICEDSNLQKYIDQRNLWNKIQ